MKYQYLILFTLFIFSCDKEKCYTIEGKEINNGEYYLLLENNRDYGSSNYNSNDNLYTGIPDPYGTGKVDKETYDSVSIGDKYCN
ncbi:MAG: hypothetical protein P8M27_02210 [Flavobacteriaceae bacterium]|jgi:hypothetical protein|nr:hypothetical protein [Flavobacteriaceae bacterium]|tara:strand:+ start:2202 stop:2456 length:255 start_codon:yes stop_codon:yes gene_type:complete